MVMRPAEPRIELPPPPDLFSLIDATSNDGVWAPSANPRTDSRDSNFMAVDTRLRLQMFECKVQHHAVQVLDQRRLADAVARFGIEHEPERLLRLLQFIDELHRILRMHV